MSPYNFERFFDLSMDMCCIANLDGYFKRVNGSFKRILGWSEKDLTDQPFIEFIHPDDVDATLSEVKKLSEGQPTASFNNRYRCTDGRYRHLQWTAYPEPETRLLFAIARDMTDLIEANQRFQLALDASPAALLMVDQKGLIQLINRETEKLFGYDRASLTGQPIEILVPKDVREKHIDHRTRFSQKPEKRSMGKGRQLHALKKNGGVFQAEIGLNPVALSDGTYVLCTVYDITHQKKIEESMVQLTKELKSANNQLEVLSVTDQLTGIFNRRAFDEHLKSQIDLMSRLERPISLLMIDIDHFKQFNDRFGHPEGDSVLKIVAELLSQNCRVTDIVARYGGEEFSMILPGTYMDGAKQMGKKLRSTFASYPWTKKSITLSIGAATILIQKGHDQSHPDYDKDLISKADRALYYSKNHGRDQLTHIHEIETGPE